VDTQSTTWTASIPLTKRVTEIAVSREQYPLDNTHDNAHESNSLDPSFSAVGDRPPVRYQNNVIEVDTMSTGYRTVNVPERYLKGICPLSQLAW